MDKRKQGFAMNLEKDILNQIDELLEKARKELNREFYADDAEISFAVTNLFDRIYGPHSPQLRQLEATQRQAYEMNTWEHTKRGLVISNLCGYLRALKSDVEEGRIANIQSEARGEVLGDFLLLAREALEEGEKDVAAVLACAALEDALKRYASALGLEVQDKKMQTVVNALKSRSVISSSQGRTLDGYVQIRNDTFHARWAAISGADVGGIIGYTQGLIDEQSLSSIPADDPADSPAEAQG